MKNKILLLLLFTSITLFSQKYVDTLYNFKITDGKLVWQKVFKNNSNLKKHLKANNFTNTLKQQNNTFTGTTNTSAAAVVKFTPYFASFNYFAFCVIDTKPDKFRVTLSNITFDGPTIRVSGLEQKQNYYLTKEAIKKNKIKNSKNINKVLKALNTTFTNHFTIKTTSGDW